MLTRAREVEGGPDRWGPPGGERGGRRRTGPGEESGPAGGGRQNGPAGRNGPRGKKKGKKELGRVLGCGRRKRKGEVERAGPGERKRNRKVLHFFYNDPNQFNSNSNSREF